MAGENDPTTFVPIPPQVAAKFPDLVANTPPGFVAPAFAGEPLPSGAPPVEPPAPGGYGAPVGDEVVIDDPLVVGGQRLHPDDLKVAPVPPPPEVFPVPPRDDTIVGAGAISEDLFGQPSDAALDIGGAIYALKRGNRIARAGWNGQYLEIEHGRILYHDGGARELCAVFSDGLLATDWRIVS